ncbi:MAG: hypothetical protein LC794_16500 [Acidobacteria bacterium]|nr:hypothetical protein [Acidobacteriota bacterium]
MTLIAAFRCYDAIVICADSQETLTVPTPEGYYADYRCSVDKIRPQLAGEYEFVIGGSGDGPLVDGFTDRLTDEITSWQGKHDSATVKSKIRELLLDFHRNEVAVSPAYDKSTAFILCVKHASGESDPLLYELRGSTIKPVSGYSMIGWDEAIYRHEVERLYQEGWVRNRSINLGIHLFLLAKKTSNVIGGDTQIMIASNRGIQPLERDTIQELESRVTNFNERLSELILMCPDLSIHNDEFRGYLQNLIDYVLEWRENYIQQSAQAAMRRTFNDANYTPAPFQIVPLGLYVDIDEEAGAVRLFGLSRTSPDTKAQPDSETSEEEP